MDKMNTVVLAICLFGAAFGQNARPLDDIIADVIAETDVDGDGVVTVSEFQTEFLTKWANGQESVNKDDFVLLWTTTYGDDPQTTSQFFDNMDAFYPKALSTSKIDSDIVDVIAKHRNSSFNQAGVTMFCNNIDEFSFEGQESVNKDDFVLLWTTTYGDDPQTTSQFFDNMDAFYPRGVINELDLLMHFPTIDSNGDGSVSTQEFDDFIHKVHPDGNGK